MADQDDPSDQRLDAYKQRVYGSTADQRQGLDPNYRPGYGRSSPRNTIGPSMTPASDWDAMFHAQNAAQNQVSPPAIAQPPIASTPRLNAYSGVGEVTQPSAQVDRFGMTSNTGGSTTYNPTFDRTAPSWVGGGVGNGQISIDPKYSPTGGLNIASVRSLPANAPSYVGDENGDQSIPAQIRRQKDNRFGDDQGDLDRVNAYA